MNFKLVVVEEEEKIFILVLLKGKIVPIKTIMLLPLCFTQKPNFTGKIQSLVS